MFFWEIFFFPRIALTLYFHLANIREESMFVSQTHHISYQFHIKSFLGLDFAVLLNFAGSLWLQNLFGNLSFSVSILMVYGKAKNTGILVFRNPVAVNVGKHKEDHTTNSPAGLLSLSIFWCHGWRHRADLHGSLCPRWSL